MKTAVAVALGFGLLFGEPTTVERTVRFALAVSPGVVLALDHRYGNVAVTGAGGDSVVVEARIVVSGRQIEQLRLLAEQVNVNAQPGPETLRVTTFYPDAPGDDSATSFEVDLSVQAPEQVPLSVSNVFGDIQLRGMVNLCWASVRYGQLDMAGCGSSVVTGRYSDVNVADLRGSLAVDNDFGNVLLRDVHGKVRIVNRYGHVESEGNRGAVSIDNCFGDVRCHQDSGSLTVDNRVGDVRAWLSDSQLAELSLVSRVGRIELGVQPGLGYRLTGLVRHGAVLAGVPLQLADEGEWRRFTGLAGEDGAVIELLAYNGDIVISTEKPSGTPAGKER